MARWLFRVFDAFNVRGNGWVLVPGGGGLGEIMNNSFV